MIITIDGPSGSGKGTVSRRIAEKFDLALLDSGAIYRLAALAALKKRIALDAEQALAAMAEKLDIGFVVDGSITRVILDGVDVSREIRDEETGMAASAIAPLPALRAALLERQRSFANTHGLVADGRDMGTVVFPDAPFKFFLTASAEERARRRMLQLAETGAPADYDTILADICARDERDIHRAAAPLRPAEDAVKIDSTDLSIDEVVDLICSAVNASKRSQ